MPMSPLLKVYPGDCITFHSILKVTSEKTTPVSLFRDHHSPSYLEV